MTDLELKKALCGMLPEKIIRIHNAEIYEYDFMWNLESGNRGVRDTELLHICWLVEQGLDKSEFEHGRYYMALSAICKGSDHDPNGASWQQRALALCKVKGITI